MSKASNAVLALSRAFYGKRLTAREYGDLLSCKSINEIASYLRTRTAYSKAFENVPATAFTASSLEAVAEKYSFDKFISICRYELAIGNEFYKYFIVKTEVEQILGCTLLMLGGSREEYLRNMGSFLDRHLSIDLYALGKANSLEEIAQALEKTRYEAIYKKCLASAERSYLTFELAFETFFEKYQDELIEKCFKGAEKKEMREIICRSFDKMFIEKQLRITQFYTESLSVSNLVIPSSVSMTLFTQKQVGSLLSATTKKEIYDVLSKSPYKNCVRAEAAETEKQLYLDFYRYCKKQIRFSSEPAVVMYCYLFLAENEVKNIVHIIEGVKYNIAQEEIKNSLIGVGD